MSELDKQPDYRQQTISGSKWTRCLHIEANNPYGGQPAIRFDEEERVILQDGQTLGRPTGTITRAFTDPLAEFQLLDPTTGAPAGGTMTHGQVYAVLWSLYIDSARIRDAEEAAEAAIAAAQPPRNFGGIEP